MTRKECIETAHATITLIVNVAKLSTNLGKYVVELGFRETVQELQTKKFWNVELSQICSIFLMMTSPSQLLENDDGRPLRIRPDFCRAAGTTTLEIPVGQRQKAKRRKWTENVCKKSNSSSSFKPKASPFLFSVWYERNHYQERGFVF